VYLPISQALPVEVDDAYRVIAFLSWVPNLIVAELYLRARRRRGSSIDQSVASPIRMTPTKIISQ